MIFCFASLLIAPIINLSRRKMWELIYDEVLESKREIYRPKDNRACVSLLTNGDCLDKKLYAKENGVYLDLKCQFRNPNLSDCPDYQPEEKK